MKFKQGGTIYHPVLLAKSLHKGLKSDVLVFFSNFGTLFNNLNQFFQWETKIECS